jgi:hypothetical protein
MFRRVLASLTSALAVVGSACGGHRVEQALEPAFPSLALADTVEIKDQKGLVMLSGSFATTSEKRDELERTAMLGNPANKSWKGVAEIDIDRKDGQVTDDEIELSVKGLPKDTNCTLIINRLEVSRFMTNDDGKAEVHLKRAALATRQ